MIRAASRFQSLKRVAARPVTAVNLDRPKDSSSSLTIVPPCRQLVPLPTVVAAFSSSHNVIVLGQQQQQQQRQFSSSSSPDQATDSTNNTAASVDETLDKLFQDSQQQQQIAETTAASSSSGDAWYAAAENAVAWEPTWYNLADQAILAVKGFHDLSGIEYGWSIVGVTLIMRLALFPLMVSSQRTASRMAHLQPELTQMKQRYESIGTPTRQDQVQFSNQMKSLFKRYKVSPIGAIKAPLVQFPLFMGMFFGLKKMPGIYHDELATGGMLWFPDLTVPDPLYILPLTATSTFLALIEVGKDQMMTQNPAQGQVFVNMFRAMSLVMLPVCCSFESAMLCYWTANNVLTLGQTAFLKNKAVRKYFDIWDPPKPVPGTEPESLTDAMSKLAKTLQGEARNERQRIERHNQAVDAKKKASRLVRASRDRRRGITGKKV